MVSGACKLAESLQDRVAALEAVLARVVALEATTQKQGAALKSQGEALQLLQAENRELRRSVVSWELARVKAHSEPVSVRNHSRKNGGPPANLLTVLRLEGFERQIAACVTPCTGNRKLAGKVAWNKLQKTCRDLRHAEVPLELDPSVRLVPDNFPTIRRAVQNVDKHDALDRGRICVRARETPYVEQLVLDRRVALAAEGGASVEIHGRICVDKGAAGTVIRDLTVRNNNPHDPWGSAIDVNGAKDVLIEGCELSSSANDETILNLHGGCCATVRGNTVSGGGTQGVTGISIDGAAMVVLSRNKICGSSVGVTLTPSATATITDNVISGNQRGVQLNEDSLEAIVDHGGFGRIKMQGNTFVGNRDGSDDAAFLRSLEMLLHPLLRRQSHPETDAGSTFGILRDSWAEENNRQARK